MNNFILFDNNYKKTFFVLSLIGILTSYGLDFYKIGNNNIIYLAIYLVIVGISVFDIKSIAFDKLKIEFNKVKEQIETISFLSFILASRWDGPELDKIKNFLIKEYIPKIQSPQTQDVINYMNAWEDFDNYHYEHAISSIKDEEVRKQKENYAEKKLSKATDEFLDKIRKKNSPRNLY